MANVSYVADNAPSLSMRLQDNPEIVVQFVNKMLKLDNSIPIDQDKIRLLDKLIQERDNIRLLVRKVDVQRALALAAAHKATMGAQNASAKGATTSDHGSQAHRLILARQDAEARLMADGVAPEKISGLLDELERDNNMSIARRVEGLNPDASLIIAPKDGFIPQAGDKPVVKETQLQQLPPMPKDPNDVVSDNPENKPLVALTGSERQSMSISKVATQ